MTIRVCTIEQRNDDGKPIGRCRVPLGVEHEQHVNAFGEPFTNITETQTEYIRRRWGERCVEEWAALPDGSPVPQAARGIVRRLEALGLAVDVYRATVGVDETRFAEDGKLGKKGELRKAAFERHDFIVVGREAQSGERLRVLAAWKLELTEKGKPAFDYAQTYAPPVRTFHTTATSLKEWLAAEESLR